MKRLWRQSAHRAAPCSLRRSTGHVVFPAVHGRCTELPGDPRRGSDPVSSPPCYATSAQRWVANAGQADGKTVTSGPGSRPFNAATRTPFECARPNHPKRQRSLVSGSPPINYASASGCLRERQLWHRPHRCESTVPTRRAHYRCCVCWTRLARRLRRARRAILTCHRMHCSLWLQTEREAGLQ